MDENARKRKIATDRGKRAATALGMDYEYTSPRMEVIMESGRAQPQQRKQPSPPLDEEVLNLLVDILHFADTHSTRNLKLEDLAKQAVTIHDEERIKTPSNPATPTAPEYQG